VPAPVVPVASLVGGLVGDDDEVEHSGLDAQIATWAQIRLGGGIGLDRGDRHPEKIAHTTTAIVASAAPTTMTMSRVDLSCRRKGLKPTS